MNTHTTFICCYIFFIVVSDQCICTAVSAHLTYLFEVEASGQGKEKGILRGRFKGGCGRAQMRLGLRRLSGKIQTAAHPPRHMPVSHAHLPVNRCSVFFSGVAIAVHIL